MSKINPLIILLFGILYSISNVSSQNLNLKWIDTFGDDTDTYETVKYIKIDANNNIYSVGTYNGNVDFDTGPNQDFHNSFGDDIDYIHKRDSDGNLLWFVDFNSLGTDLDPRIDAFEIDEQGNIFLSGFFREPFDADPSPTEFLLGENSQFIQQLFIIKLDADGNLLWCHYLTNSILVENIAVELNGNINIVGWFGGTIDVDPSPAVYNLTENSSAEVTAYILVLNSQGEFIKANILTSDIRSTLIDVDFDNLGNKYYLGYFSGNLDIDLSPAVDLIGSQSPEGAYFVLKFDSNDNLLWERRIPVEAAYGRASFIELCVDDQNNIILAGTLFRGTLDLDPESSTFNVTYPFSSAYYGSIIVKWDTDGSFLWARSFVGNSAIFLKDIHIDTNNDIYSCGNLSSHNAVDFDDGASDDIHLAGGGNNGDLFLNKISTNGDYLWTYTMNSMEGTVLYSVSTNTDNEIIVGGNFVGTVDFDPSTSSAIVTESGTTGFSDAFILKYSQPTLNIESNYFKIEPTIFPNPMDNSCVINLYKEYESITIQITNLLGEVIQKKSEINNSIISIENVNTSGVYSILLEADGEQAVFKLIKK